MIALLGLIAAAFLVLRPAILGASTVASIATAAGRRAVAVRRMRSKWRRFKTEHPEALA